MAEFLITLGVLLCAVAGLGIGAIFGRAPIKGSCGGLSCIAGADCAACPNRTQRGDQS
ncbi:(Na+)-NQR maturation NqrM [Salipiger sp. 1_MG-2023]|uniref:(Na+)-NQR maturation NqrM n=1 Tax=Salipiger sp. 1_MG-2023 TaxID=3062665 RepID=UPI0026E3348B|nr:(Na+)-NQR maturation NqrM [Salipiger sp. 1_MG-2023]MDO6587840.1 (Na+)-NQR maturation NqrM [Salipiger sp. 1_MG-2023]